MSLCSPCRRNRITQLLRQPTHALAGLGDVLARGWAIVIHVVNVERSNLKVGLRLCLSTSEAVHGILLSGSPAALRIDLLVLLCRQEAFSMKAIDVIFR